ncbi:MAG TPA: hypothetical protein VGK67_03465 [Myxococcales bacterium]|jgi:hypothetical protein
MADPDRKAPKYPLFPVDQGPLREERTAGVTGEDATVDEAAFGDAGNGADVWSDDLAGGIKPIEDAGEGQDIQPDQVRRFLVEPEEEEGEERELTAQPNEPMPPDPTDNS